MSVRARERLSQSRVVDAVEWRDDFDPLRVVASAAGRTTLFYMERPDAGESIVTLDAIATNRCSGTHRFEDADAAAAALLDTVVAGGERASVDIAPRLVGGFGFADDCESSAWRDFAPCLFVLPREQWITENGRTIRIRIGEAHEEDAAGGLPRRWGEDGSRPLAITPTTEHDEAPSHWVARARAALDQIEAGYLSKIVLARRESRSVPPDLDVTRVLARLRAARPSCYTFCFAVGDSMFLGSSPEKLLGVRDGRVDAEALAGTIARGATTEEDGFRRQELLASTKDRREHAAVVDGIRDALTPCVTRLSTDGTPEIRAFPEGFHLRTRVTGTISPRASLFDLIAALHPTPAVCGVPRVRAQEVLRRLEPGRGWYTGGVGWIDGSGDGLFAVALRAGLIARGRLETWAGAGIVAGSNAERELSETDLKMRALLAVVEEVERSS